MEWKMDNLRKGREINLIEYCSIVWRRKAVFGGIVLAGGILALAVSLITPDIYRADAVITPVKSQEASMGGGIPTLAQQFGGLPGISLPDSGSTAEIISLLESNILREKVLERSGVMQMIFAERWDADKKEWRGAGPSSFLSGLLDRAKTLLRPKALEAAAFGNGNAPTVWEGIRKLKEMVSIVQSARENTITISADALSAETSAKTVGYILDTLNEHMSAEAQRVARVNRAYLEGQLDSAPDPIIRQKIYSLVARQIEMDMMAEVKENFAFKVIDPPMVPDQRISPKRTRMVASGVAASLIVGLFAAFLLDFAERRGRRAPVSCVDEKSTDGA